MNEDLVLYVKIKKKKGLFLLNFYRILKHIAKKEKKNKYNCE